MSDNFIQDFWDNVQNEEGKFRVDTRTQNGSEVVERIAEAFGIERPDDAIALCAAIDRRVQIIDHDGQTMSADYWLDAWRRFLHVEERHISAYGDQADALRTYATQAGYIYVDMDAASKAEDMDDEALAVAVEEWTDWRDSSDWGDADEGRDGSDDGWDYPEWRMRCATAAAYAVEQASRAIEAGR